MSIQQSNRDFSGAGRVPIHASSLLTWLIMLIGLLVTFGIWHLSNGDISSSAQERFDVRAAQIVTAVEQRMHAYEQVLRGGVGLFRTSATITRQQWHEYVENANMAKNYPGIQNMAIDVPVPAAEKNAHIARIRAEGHADYSIRPEQPDRPLYHSVIYAEPFGGRNLRAFGFDMYTNATRRESMDRTIDFGIPAMSGMVKLAQETNEDVQHGFIYCLPVYYADRPANTPEQRRAALRALVCGAFRANDLMQGIFGNSNKDLELEIFDEAISPTSLLYDSRHGDKSTISKFSRTTSAEIGGRTWQLRISANQAYMDSVSFTQSRLVAVAGVTLSFLLFFGVGFVIRKHDREVMHKNSELFKAMQDSVKESLLVIDKEGVILSANPTGVERFALTADQIVGRNIFELMSSEASVSWRSSVIEVARSGLPVTFEDYREVRSYLNNLYPVLDRNKQCEAIVVFAADITERKQTEDELRDSRIFLNSIIECSPNSMWISDEHGTMMRMNQACRDKLHLRDEEVVGKYNVLQDNIINQQGFMPLVKDVFEKGVIARFVTSYDTSAVKSLELDQITRLDLDISISPILNRQGKVTNAIIQHTDITELKQTEAELMRHRNRLEELVITRTAELEQAKDAAEKANLAKSDFLSSMSHELRTPLNAILGFAQLMESESPPPTPVQKEGINEILHSGWHLLILINEILDLAKVESGHAPLSLEPVLLAEVLLECQKMIGPQAQQRCITVTFPVLDKSSYIRADRIRLKQVLINLLSNAIKYNSKQGKIEVICTESKPRRIRVSIKDSGAGLNPEQLSQLFQPFSRLGQEAGAEEGTGIGLVVAKRLVELMGGNMGVESTVGTGSTFWFELISVAEPHLSVEEVDPAELTQPVVSREAQLHTVLYVEDNPSNLKLVKQIIARHSDMCLLTAVDGLSGIEIARKSQPDVILMDINMPGMNGYKALEILKSDPTTAHIPVLALTANAMPRDIKKGMEAGFFRYITKPIMVNELMEALNVALESAEH